MRRKTKPRRAWLTKLNYLFWTLALTVWCIILWRTLQKGQPVLGEPLTDPVHVTGSREPLFSTPIENGTRTDSRLIPDEALLVFIIDDFGPAWQQQIVDGFLKFPANITLSIIPGNSRSKSAAKAADESGKEVFIHLPMEPTERVAVNERDMVWVKSDSDELRKVLDRALSEIPNAVGLNNHMGSRATSNRRLMKLLGTELRRRSLYFVDSRTSEKSEALRAMQESGVDAIGRDVFLDVDGDSASVAARIAETARIARRRGWAVAIGHVKGGTLAALTAAAPNLERAGFTFVSAGELIERLLGNSVGSSDRIN